MGRKTICTSLISTLCILLMSAVASAATNGGGVTKSNEIRIMSYNLENLFDTEHDAGKSDWDFLPIGYPGKKEGCETKSSTYKARCFKTDWTPARLQIKLEQIKKIVTSNGGLPDVLAVQEIENLNVLSMLAQKLGYKHYILEEGPDNRGIDVALLYKTDKLTYLSHKSRKLGGKEFATRATRDILTVYFSFPKSKKADNVLAVYVNHWPSQAAPAKKRVATAKNLKKFMATDRSRYGASYHGIVLGDFNTIDSDYPHPFNSVILDKGWKNHLLDTHDIAKVRNLPFGTYFYPVKMTWNVLDRIFITQNLNDNKGVDAALDSYDIVNPKFATRTHKLSNSKSPHYGTQITGAPNRYDFNSDKGVDAGFSDHFGVSVKLRY